MLARASCCLTLTIPATIEGHVRTGRLLRTDYTSLQYERSVTSNNGYSGRQKSNCGGGLICTRAPVRGEARSLSSRRNCQQSPDTYQRRWDGCQTSCVRVARLNCFSSQRLKIFS